MKPPQRPSPPWGVKLVTSSKFTKVPSFFFNQKSTRERSVEPSASYTQPPLILKVSVVFKVVLLSVYCKYVGAVLAAFSTLIFCPFKVIILWSSSAFNTPKVSTSRFWPCTKAAKIAPSSPALSVWLILASTKCPISSNNTPLIAAKEALATKVFDK